MTVRLRAHSHHQALEPESPAGGGRRRRRRMPAMAVCLLTAVWGQLMAPAMMKVAGLAK